MSSSTADDAGASGERTKSFKSPDELALRQTGKVPILKVGNIAGFVLSVVASLAQCQPA
jgi:hypothetical protein